MKTCRKCGESKETSAFRRNARTSDGLSSWCAGCHNDAKRGYRRKRKAEALLEEAAAYEREADALDPYRAQSARSTASALRREAARELAAW